jgi:hypothetical protein
MAAGIRLITPSAIERKHAAALDPWRDVRGTPYLRLSNTFHLKMPDARAA